MSSPKSPRSNAFTLIELLVVLTIIGILAAIGLPAIRGMTRSHAMIAGNRQFLDDLALARQTAIAQHTTVYVVFVPTNVGSIVLPGGFPTLDQQITNLYTGRYNTYALLSLRQVGDQPGRTTPKYITGWRTLPAGVFIPQEQFNLPPPSAIGGTGFSLETLPFPVATNYPILPGSLPLQLPCLAFNYLGQLTDPNPFATVRDQYIPLVRGSIFYNPVSPNGAADIQVNPIDAVTTTNITGVTYYKNNNVVYINALTGRAKIFQPQIQ
jgi:prepilin-type N-terminal cleavage/methylation domain-containing protein